MPGMRAALLLVVLVPLAGCFLLEGEEAEPQPGCVDDLDCGPDATCVEGACRPSGAAGGAGGGGGAVASCGLAASELEPPSATQDARFGYAMVALGGDEGRLVIGAPGLCNSGVAPPAGRVWLAGGSVATPIELPLGPASGAAQLGATIAIGELDGRRVVIAATSRLRDPNGVTRDCPGPTKAEPLVLAVWDEDALLLATDSSDAPAPACTIRVPLAESDALPRGSDPALRLTWTLLLPGDLDGSGGAELVIGRPEASAIVVAADLHGCTGADAFDLEARSTGAPIERAWEAATGYGAALAVVGGAGAKRLVVGAPHARAVELVGLVEGELHAEPLVVDPPSLGRFGAAFAVSGEGGLLAVSAPRPEGEPGADGAVSLFDVATGQERARVVPEGELAFKFGSALLFATGCDGTESLVVAAAREDVPSGGDSVEGGRVFTIPLDRLAAATTPLVGDEPEGYGARARLGSSLARLPGGFAAGAPERSVGIGYAGSVRRFGPPRP